MKIQSLVFLMLLTMLRLESQYIQELKASVWIGNQVLGNQDILGAAKKLMPFEGQCLLNSFIESPTGNHYLFQQYFEDVLVYKSSYKVNTDKAGNIISIFQNTFSESQIESPLNDLDVYVFDDKQLYPASFKRILKNDIWVEEVSFLDKTKEHYLGSYFDSLATVAIFEPDPLTTASANYGSPYEDQDDADVDLLNAERMNRNIVTEYDAGTFRLQNEFCIIKELSAPTTIPATSTNGVFDFTRNQSEFEEVNAYYHILKQKDYLSSLGFTSLMAFPIEVDAHALNGSDNSMFSSGFDVPRLLFGDGGVDDAEDADVIIHEYTHAVQFDAAPNTNFGTERNTLDEANGDYFAASYSMQFSLYNWDRVYTWDGHNEYWSGRMVQSEDHYPQDLVGNRYSDADIWSSTLIEIHDEIGREVTDEILLQSIYSYSMNMSMKNAAELFIQADSLLNNGDNYLAAHYYFAHRGLLPWDTINSVKEYQLDKVNLFTHDKTLIIESALEEKLNLSIFDLTGRLIKEVILMEPKTQVLLTKSGIYIAQIKNDAGHQKSTRFFIH